MANTGADTLPEVDEDWFTVEEIASRLKVSPFTVRRWLREGLLRGRSFGGKTGWRVNGSDLRQFLENRTTEDRDAK